MGGWDDAAYYEEEAAQAEFIENTLKNISEDGVRNYLGTYGDAVDERISHCMREARMLLTGGFFQSATVSAVTAIELTIRFLLLRPLVQAAFFSEEWANLLTQRVASGRTAGDREILPQILAFHGIDLGKTKLPNGSLLWRTIVEKVYKQRDKIVHRGEATSEDNATLAIQCADSLRNEIVLPYASKLGFTLDKTGCWQRTKTLLSGSRYNARDPFADKSSLPLAPEMAERGK
ncbi:hypothetical protein C2U70_20755 [Bradyrhizobium guangdongense]|uniref:hypothetical protein n=1 Tax=Bradyrhizobium guangdongense TaxID=1325090 RepID=UPI00112E9BBB|nr:hypothetical protein [Bradyrhizobium guangdongense]TPQ32798.1 hypothetical protein C2U70_20755 [Bradyrhizobium guangdongense]